MVVKRIRMIVHLVNGTSVASGTEEVREDDLDKIKAGTADLAGSKPAGSLARDCRGDRGARGSSDGQPFRHARRGKNPTAPWRLTGITGAGCHRGH